MLAGWLSADIITFIVEIKQLLQEQLYSVFQIALIEHLVALWVLAPESALPHLLLAVLHLDESAHSWKLVCLLASEANYFECGDRSVFQFLASFSHQSSILNRVLIFFLNIVASLYRGILVLLGIHTQALSHEVNLKAFDMLNQSRDWRQQLVGDVPVIVYGNALFFIFGHGQVFIRAVTFIAQILGRLLLTILALIILGANHIRNEVINEVGLTLTL
jgi:hypothetical protein